MARLAVTTLSSISVNPSPDGTGNRLAANLCFGFTGCSGIQNNPVKSFVRRRSRSVELRNRLNRESAVGKTEPVSKIENAVLNPRFRENPFTLFCIHAFLTDAIWPSSLNYVILTSYVNNNPSDLEQAAELTCESGVA